MSKSIFKNSFYNFLDLITLKKGVVRKINTRKIRFPARWSRYYPGDYESDNYLFLEQQVREGMHIFDIGAHIGLFSVCASQLTGPKGKTICFEPTPGTFPILKETLRLNHCDNVIALQAAVSDKEGRATFYVSHTAGCNSNSLVKNKSENELSAYEVQLFTIDGIVSAYSLSPALIKIDVEGAELDVLKGGLKTFKNHKPALIIDLHPAFIKQKGDTLETIWELLSDAGYQVEEEGKVFTKPDFCNRITLFDVHCTRS